MLDGCGGEAGFVADGAADSVNSASPWMIEDAPPGRRRVLVGRLEQAHEHREHHRVARRADRGGVEVRVILRRRIEAALHGQPRGPVFVRRRPLLRRTSFETPISMLYALPENVSSDLTDAFQPKRLIVPSPARLNVPLMPNWLGPGDARYASRSESSMFSIRPLPNTGVGMRKLMLLLATAAAKFGCANEGVQVLASLRPAMVKSACTLPSGVTGDRNAGAVREEFESCLAHRAVDGDERRHGVRGPVRGGVGHLRIGRGTGASRRGLGVAGHATARVEARPESVVRLPRNRAEHGADLLEATLRVVEEREDRRRSVRGDGGKGTARGRRTTAGTRIDLRDCLEDDQKRSEKRERLLTHFQR